MGTRITGTAESGWRKDRRQQAEDRYPELDTRFGSGPEVSEEAGRSERRLFGRARTRPRDPRETLRLPTP